MDSLIHICHNGLPKTIHQKGKKKKIYNQNKFCQFQHYSINIFFLGVCFKNLNLLKLMNKAYGIDAAASDRGTGSKCSVMDLLIGEPLIVTNLKFTFDQQNLC